MITVGDFRIGEEERQAIKEVLDSGRISEGQKVREFEKEWAKYVGTKYAVALNSGTSALIAGLKAIRLSGHVLSFRRNAITSPVTYIATSNALRIENYRPVFVDVDPETFVITPENIKACLEEADYPTEYSIILPVHLMGYPCDMDEINKIAKKYDLITFEDSAQAHGTLYKGKKTGNLSLLSDFSFYIAHNIQAGELGTINTDNYEIIRLVKKIKANGRACDCPVCTRNTIGCPKLGDTDPRFTHDIVGYNFKAMEFQAALALCQLKKADWIKEQRNENVKYLNEELEILEGSLQLPKYSKDVSYLAYPIVCKKGVSRKKLTTQLESKGIETRPLFGCIPTSQPAYDMFKDEYHGRLPNAEYIGENGFYIGCHQYLTRDDLEYIVKTFKEVLN